MIVRTIDIRLKPLSEKTSGVISKLALLLRVFTVFSTDLRRLEIFRRKNVFIFKKTLYLEA